MLDQLIAWHRAGELAANFAAVPGLLARLTDEDLLVAGQLLATMDPEGLPTTTVALTGTGTVSSLVAPLTAEFARHGLLCRTVVGDFGTYVRDLGDPDGELRAARVVLCVLDASIVFDEVPVPFTVDDVIAAFDRKLTLFERLAALPGTLVLNTVPLPRHHFGQLVDEVSRARLGAAWREANARLLRLVDRYDHVSVIDLDPLVAEGIPVVEPRLSRYAKVNLSPALLARYAREAAHLARRLLGRTRKCLVLDLDDTLWGGVLSEDGPDGIEVDGGRRGEAFTAFQRVVKQLRSQGVLLAVASKNDLAPVLGVLRDHPGMTLREEDFVSVQASWDAKHGAIARLAEILGIGLDSLVFADDSSFECGVVRLELPEVAVVELGDEPATHVDRLLRDNWFTVRELTATDRARTGEYRRQAEREDFRRSFDVAEDHLAALGVTVRVDAVHDRDIARVSQLTLRTNQFNLTTRRLQPADVRALAAAPDRAVLTIGSADRFSDNGLVGAVFLRYEQDRVHVDNFLLSCRVFARGIEQSALVAVLRHARDRGASEVLGHHEPTAKNRKFAGFYPGNGFTAVSDAVFRHDLAEIGPPPAHVRLTGSIGGNGHEDR
ncbi:HAD-IIIC family phosphatase [Lentzea kentuckyensis]|uniref:HAD-IIIC family phosphatase n=1 Tax=Lentzea kentuckyensis TaxID=360086 RepID=UPI000A3A06CC|nr:HAD-IIIC family phosphatase [Lentzea kentuckyensis]